MTTEIALDDLDRAILDALTEDARRSWADLAAETGVSAPTIRDRVLRLMDSGVIEGFSARLSPAALGYALQAIVRFRPLPGKRHVLEQQIADIPQIVQCDKITGEDAFVARLLLRDIAELDPLLDRFARSATTNTSIVKTTLVAHRPPPLS
ncbi:MAG: Lrp/AsnC family transcriptional regulator [Marinibacterium sp.]|nr:Lrp/AsnC family transcriptional regulator [Marinibacterium sp.]